MTRLYLASASPRRAGLLAQIGVTFERVLPDVDETMLPGELPAAYVGRLARAKASAGQRMAVAQATDPAPCTLGADTIVVQGDEVFGKPRDASDHRRMMLALAGCSHLVYTAVALCTEPVADGADAGDKFEHKASDQFVLSCTEVRFKPLPESEIESYWATGEPCDKAGGYAIQGLGALLVESIAGSYSGVVGLPLCETGQLLRSAGIVTALDR